MLLHWCAASCLPMLQHFPLVPREAWVTIELLSKTLGPDTQNLLSQLPLFFSPEPTTSPHQFSVSVLFSPSFFHFSQLSFGILTGPCFFFLSPRNWRNLVNRSGAWRFDCYSKQWNHNAVWRCACQWHLHCQWKYADRWDERSKSIRLKIDLSVRIHEIPLFSRRECPGDKDKPSKPSARRQSWGNWRCLQHRRA